VATIKKYAKASDGPGKAGTVDFLKLLEQYPDKIIENKPIRVEAAERIIMPKMDVIEPEKEALQKGDLEGLDISKNLLVSLVKADNLSSTLINRLRFIIQAKSSLQQLRLTSCTISCRTSPSRV
jgi:hypothetical protein